VAALPAAFDPGNPAVLLAWIACVNGLSPDALATSVGVQIARVTCSQQVYSQFPQALPLPPLPGSFDPSLLPDWQNCINSGLSSSPTQFEEPNGLSFFAGNCSVKLAGLNPAKAGLPPLPSGMDPTLSFAWTQCLLDQSNAAQFFQPATRDQALATAVSFCTGVLTSGSGSGTSSPPPNSPPSP